MTFGILLKLDLVKIGGWTEYYDGFRRSFPFLYITKQNWLQYYNTRRWIFWGAMKMKEISEIWKISGEISRRGKKFQCLKISTFV